MKIVLLLAIGASLFAEGPPKFKIVEATIPEMRTAMEHGKLTSRELVSQYLIRIALYEHTLKSAIAINPKALEEADARDRWNDRLWR